MSFVEVSPFHSAGIEQWDGYVLMGEQDPIPGFNETSDDFVTMLSPPLQARAELVAAQLVDIIGVEAGTVRYVPEVIADGATRIVAVDGSPNSLYGGKFIDVQTRLAVEPDWLKIDVDGERISVLEATTYAVYWAMINGAKNESGHIPDSIELSQVNDMPWTASLLTGEQATDEGNIYVGSVSSITVNTVDHRPRRGGKTIRLRPSVVVGEM